MRTFAEYLKLAQELNAEPITGPEDYIEVCVTRLGSCAGSLTPMFSWSEHKISPLEAYLVAQDAIAQHPAVRPVVERVMYRTHARTQHRSPWALDGAFVLPHGQYGALVSRPLDGAFVLYEDEGDSAYPENTTVLFELVRAGLSRLNTRRKACEGIMYPMTRTSAGLEEAYAWAARYNASVGYLHLYFSEYEGIRQRLDLPTLYPTMLD